MIGWRSRGAAALVAMVCASLLAAGCGAGEEPTESAPPQFFGVITQTTPTDEDFADMQDGGLGVYRTAIPWKQVEPARGQFDFTAIDGLVAGAAAHDLEVLPYLYLTPDWAAQLDGSDCADDCALYAPRTDASLEAWREFVAAAAGRYGPGGDFWREHPELPAKPIRAWQIWNEQNSPTAYLPAPDPPDYARLVDTAAAAIHARDPDAEIVLGGMFGTPLGGESPAITSIRFLDELYEIEGPDPSFDTVAVHPYGAQASKVAEQLEAVSGVIEAAGDDARLWVTELGWSSGRGAEPLERGPEGQAESLTEAYDYLLENRSRFNLQGVVWYSWRDLTGAGICAWCARSGLFTEDGTPKPAWDALTSLTGASD